MGVVQGLVATECSAVREHTCGCTPRHKHTSYKAMKCCIDQKVSLILITSVVLALINSISIQQGSARGAAILGTWRGTLGTLLQPRPPELTVLGKLV